MCGAFYLQPARAGLEGLQKRFSKRKEILKYWSRPLSTEHPQWHPPLAVGTKLGSAEGVGEPPGAERGLKTSAAWGVPLELTPQRPAVPPPPKHAVLSLPPGCHELRTTLISLATSKDVPWRRWTRQVRVGVSSMMWWGGNPGGITALRLGPGARPLAPGLASLSCPGYTDAFLVAGLSDPSGTWQYMLLSSRTFNWILWPTCCPDLEGILGLCHSLCLSLHSAATYRQPSMCQA